MSDITCDRYIAEEGGLGLASVRKIQDQILSAKKQRWELRTKYGADGTFENAYGVKGLIFNSGKVPDAFKNSGFTKMESRDLAPGYRGKVFKPNTRSTAGRKLLQEFTIPIVGAHEFHNELTRNYKGGTELMIIQTGPHRTGGFPIGFSVFETFEVARKKVVVISVPRNWTGENGYKVVWTPPEDYKLKPIDQAKYWKWKETADKKKAAKAKEKEAADA